MQETASDHDTQGSMSSDRMSTIMREFGTSQRETNVAEPTASTTPSPMDRLPLELAAMVMDNLIEYERPFYSFASEAMEQLSNRAHDHSVTYYFMDRNWMMLEGTAIIAVLNARLACSKLYHSSRQSLAKVLANRTFRYTSNSMKTLQKMGQDSKLAPLITTITIGCTGLRYPYDTTGLKEELRDYEALDDCIKAFQEFAEWQENELSTSQIRLTKLFRAFPNLTTVRIHTGLPMQSSEVWLKALMYHTDNGLWRLLSDMYDPNTILIDDVISALKDAKTRLKDFRVSLSEPIPECDSFFENGLPVTNLHTFCVTLPHVCPDGLDIIGGRLAEVLLKAPNLQDLTLLPTPEGGFEDGSIFFSALKHRTKLRRIWFDGPWTLREDSLVPFISLHAHSLRCLVFNYIILYGSWSETTRATGRASQGRLEYFRATEVREFAPDRGFSGEDARPTDLTEEDFADFRCPVRFDEMSEWVSRAGQSFEIDLGTRTPRELPK